MTSSLDRDALLIGTRWRSPETDAVIEVVSPHTEEVVARVPEGSVADMDAAVAAAREAFDNGPWPRMSPAERIEVVARLSELYSARLDEMAEVISTEMGSPIAFSKLAQAPAPWMQIEAFLKIAREYPWEETRPGALGGDVLVRHEPVGVVAAIPPWNVPQFTVLSKLIPALLTGCTIVIKPAPETPLDTYLLADLLIEAGVPEGVVSIVAGGREVGEHLVRHPGVDKVAFTGSTAAGRRIGAICGEQLKRVSLELGGKSAAIVLDDADVDAVVEGLKFVGVMNSGQACVAQTRVLVSRERHDEIAEAVARGIGSMVVGDPMDEATQIGPMVARRQQERVNSYIELGQQEGARLLTGGADRPEGLDSGWYVQPTVFAGVDNSMRIAQEEIFGPVLTVTPYDTDEDAVAIANNSIYGLSGEVSSADVDRAVSVATRMRTGNVSINGKSHFGIDSPFGGTKQSGLGYRNGAVGFTEYLHTKTIGMPE